MKKSVIILLFSALFMAPTFFACQGSGSASSEYKMEEDTSMSLVIREWSKRISKYPENDEYRKGRAEELIKDKKLDLALADIDKAIEINSDLPEYYSIKGDLLLAMNETYKALDVYKEAAERFPKNEQSLLNLGRFHFIVRKYDEAEKSILALLGQNNSHVEGQFYYGMIRKENGDTTGAIRSFENVVLIDDEHEDALIQLASIFSDNNDARGLNYYNKLISLDSFNHEAYYGRGFLYQKLGERVLAIKDYQSTIDLNAQHFLAYYNTGYLMFEQKNWDRAIEHFRIAVKFAPDYTKGHYMLGLSNEGKGNIDQAIVHYEKSLQVDPDFGLSKEAIIRLKNK